MKNKYFTIYIIKIFNFLPLFRGKIRLASCFLTNRENCVTFKTQKGILYTVPNLIENVSLELYVNGVYEKSTIDFICKSIPINGVFIDVGANIGAVCVEVAFLRPDISVYAFEASPNVFNYLTLNKTQNGLDNLFIYNFAIHDQDNVDLPFYSPSQYNGKGSFSPVFTQLSETVRTIRLDSFLNKNNINPNFIKIDVEGYELVVFKSMSFFQNDNMPVFLFEFVDWAEQLANFEIGAAQNYLLQLGYELFSLSTGTSIKNCITIGSEMIIAKK